MSKRIAIIVGHDKDSPGAMAYDDWHTEYYFNSRVGLRVQSLLQEKNFNAVCFQKQGTDYFRVKKFQPEVTIELHCNAYDGKTPCYGTEVLIANEFSRPFAENLGLNIAKECNFRVRGEKTVKKTCNTDRGFSRLLPSLLGIHADIRVIIEPTFIDVETEESKWLLEHNYTYARVLAETIYNYFK